LLFIPGDAVDVTTPPVPLDPGSEKPIWAYPDPDSGSVGKATDLGPDSITEISGFIAVPPDSVTIIPLEYQLPNDVIRSTGRNTYEYRLLVQKQPRSTPISSISPASCHRAQN
jgi:hypothetical protein